MVLQESGERCRVRQQRVQLPLRQCSECLFARGKHGKGTFCTQRVDQTGCFQGAHQRGELAGFHSSLNDVQGVCAFLGRLFFCGRLFCRSSFGWGQQHLVDHMHDAVRSNDVCSNDRSVVDGDHIVGDSNGNRGSLLKRRQFPCNQIGGGQRLIADYVVAQHGRQLFFVCQQRLQRVCRQCVKGLVGRCKDGERALSSQGLVQTTGCQCCCQCAKIFPGLHDPTECGLVPGDLESLPDWLFAHQHRQIRACRVKDLLFTAIFVQSCVQIFCRRIGVDRNHHIGADPTGHGRIANDRAGFAVDICMNGHPAGPIAGHARDGHPLVDDGLRNRKDVGHKLGDHCRRYYGQHQKNEPKHHQIGTFAHRRQLLTCGTAE